MTQVVANSPLLQVVEERRSSQVVASGATRVPTVPGFASGLDAGIRQLNSDEFRNPGSVARGPVLVVGAGTSGAEIALELARKPARGRAQSHPVFLAGLPLDEHGLPVTRRGAVESMPGLFFVGMPFQYALTSALLGGVARDAGSVVERLSGAQ